jgi:hypothetical protein
MGVVLAVLVSVVLAACASPNPSSKPSATPSAAVAVTPARSVVASPPTSQEAAYLEITPWHNSPVIIEIGGVEVTRIHCDIGRVLIPGASGAPQLPWDLRVVRQNDGSVIFWTSMTSLPQQLVVESATAELSPVQDVILGGPGPTCAP